MLRRVKIPALIWLLSAGVYFTTSGAELFSSGAEHHYGNHYVHLARSILHGQLHIVGNSPPGGNDYAVYQDRWYVSFPPFPALVLLPFVAIWDLATPDRLIWILFAGLSPALLYSLLRFLREQGRSQRSVSDNLLLTALFAFGSVYYFSAVQGTVWFAGHVVVCALSCLYLLWSIDARRPLAAGITLGLAFISRPTTAPLAIFFLAEVLRVSRTPQSRIRPILWFGLPIALIGALSMWLNYVRFDNVFEFGHRYLNIRWQPRIDKWGLFSYHYLARNLAVFAASLPWLLKSAPFVQISGHGLALWFTTPNLLAIFWPRRTSSTMRGLYFAAAAVALFDLCYQNTGWVQFGYRFALDYMVVLIALLALGGRRFGPGFIALAVFAIAVNTFGAITFDNNAAFYFIDLSQQVLFQPD